MTIQQAGDWFIDAMMKAITFDWLQMTIGQFLVVGVVWGYATFWEPRTEYRKALKKAEEAGEPISKYYAIGYPVSVIIFAAPIFWFFWINR